MTTSDGRCLTVRRGNVLEVGESDDMDCEELFTALMSSWTIHSLRETLGTSGMKSRMTLLVHTLTSAWRTLCSRVELPSFERRVVGDDR
jgi:hypothetical protein